MLSSGGSDQDIPDVAASGAGVAARSVLSAAGVSVVAVVGDGAGVSAALLQAATRKARRVRTDKEGEETMGFQGGCLLVGSVE